MNICNILRAVESLESSLHIPIIGWAKEKESEYSARKAQTIASILQTQSAMWTVGGGVVADVEVEDVLENMGGAP